MCSHLWTVENENASVWRRRRFIINESYIWISCTGVMSLTGKKFSLRYATMFGTSAAVISSNFIGTFSRRPARVENGKCTSPNLCRCTRERSKLDELTVFTAAGRPVAIDLKPRCDNCRNILILPFTRHSTADLFNTTTNTGNDSHFHSTSLKLLRFYKLRIYEYSESPVPWWCIRIHEDTTWRLMLSNTYRVFWHVMVHQNCLNLNFRPCVNIGLSLKPNTNVYNDEVWGHEDIPKLLFILDGVRFMFWSIPESISLIPVHSREFVELCEVETVKWDTRHSLSSRTFIQKPFPHRLGPNENSCMCSVSMMEIR